MSYAGLPENLREWCDCTSDEQCTHCSAADEIDQLRVNLVESERREKAWMVGVADFVEQFGFDREAACGPADLLPGLRSAQNEIDRLRGAA